jgi:hypothetical protein
VWKFNILLEKSTYVDTGDKMEVKFSIDDFHYMVRSFGSCVIKKFGDSNKCNKSQFIVRQLLFELYTERYSLKFLHQ